MKKLVSSGRLIALFSIFALILGTSAMGQGVGLRAVSPVNESMGGAATGCPIDAAGALNWNPATIAALPSSDMSFSLGVILPQSSIESRVPTGMAPPAPTYVQGWTASETGALPVPNMAFVRQIDNSRWSYGVGVFSIGGTQVNYPSDPSNPILADPSHGGLGRLSAEVQIFQIQPTIAYEINEHWSVGFAPTITMGRLVANPLFLGPLYSDGYAAGTGTRYIWGGGFQAGVYYTTDVGWHFGASIKSPQWCEPFRYYSQDDSGDPVITKFDLDYPMIISLGCSYSGFDKWILACDLRYFDYGNTVGFDDSGFDASGAATGLGWNSIMSVGIGAQRQINEKLSVRMGYIFNENPIPSDSSAYNVASPLVLKHCVSLGASYALERNWVATFAYTCCFEESVTGLVKSAVYPDGIPGSYVKSSCSAHMLQAGISKRF